MLGASMIPLLLAALLPPAGPPDSVTAFVNIAVIPMDRERVLADQTVLVQDGRITAIGPAGTVSIPADAVRVDGKGKWLIPGLADMHAHIGRLDATAMLAYLGVGVTTVRDMGMARSAAELAERDRMRSGEVVGPTIYFASPKIGTLDTPEEAVALVHQYKTEGYDLIKMYSPELTRATLDSFAAAAHREKLPFGGHTPIGIPLEDWLKAGPVTIEHLEGYWQAFVRNYFGGDFPAPDPNMVQYAGVLEQIHETGGQSLDDSVVAALGRATHQAGVWNVPTLTIKKVLDMGRSPELHQLVQQLSGRIVKVLHGAGVGFLTGTDMNVSDATVHTELQLLVEAGLTPYEALAAGTRNVALALGTLEQTGTIEVGKRADLVMLGGDPLQISAIRLRSTGSWYADAGSRALISISGSRQGPPNRRLAATGDFPGRRGAGQKKLPCNLCCRRLGAVGGVRQH